MAGVGNPKGVGNFIGKLIPEGFYTRRQVASMLGVVYETVQRRERAGIYHPDAYMESEKGQTMPLYTLPTIERMRELSKTLSPNERLREQARLEEEGT